MSGSIRVSRKMGSLSYSHSNKDDVEVAEMSLWDLLRVGEGGSSWDGLRKRNTATHNRTSDHDIEYEMPRKVTKKSQFEQYWKPFPRGYCDDSYSDLDGNYQSRAHISDSEDEDSSEIDYGSDGRDGEDGGAFDFGLDSDNDDFDNDLDLLTDKFAAQRLKYSETERLGKEMRDRVYNRSIMQATPPGAALTAVSVDEMDLDVGQKFLLKSPISSNASKMYPSPAWKESAKRRLDALDYRPVRPLKLSATTLAKVGRHIIVACRPAPMTTMNIDNNPLASGDKLSVLRLETFTSVQIPSMMPGMGKKRSAIAIEPAHEQGSEAPNRLTMDRTPTAPGSFAQINPFLLLPYKSAFQPEKHTQRRVLQLIKAATVSPELALKEHYEGRLKTAQLKVELQLLKAKVANEDTKMEL